MSDKEITIDKKYMQAVLSEIDRLKTENESLKEENKKLRSTVQTGKSSERVEAPSSATAKRQKFEMGGTSGYIISGEYEDGTLGEIFLILGKEGTIIRGLGDAFAKTLSIAIQYGAPIKEFIKSYRDMEFFPNGAVTGVPSIRGAKSIPDLIARYIEATYIRKDQQRKEQKAESAIRQVETAIELEDDGLTLCPACETKNLKLKAAGCNHICLQCGFLDSSGGCSG